MGTGLITIHFYAFENHNHYCKYFIAFLFLHFVSVVCLLLTERHRDQTHRKRKKDDILRRHRHRFRRLFRLSICVKILVVFFTATHAKLFKWEKLHESVRRLLSARSTLQHSAQCTYIMCNINAIVSYIIHEFIAVLKS